MPSPTAVPHTHATRPHMQGTVSRSASLCLRPILSSFRFARSNRLCTSTSRSTSFSICIFALATISADALFVHDGARNQIGRARSSLADVHAPEMPPLPCRSHLPSAVGPPAYAVLATAFLVGRDAARLDTALPAARLGTARASAMDKPDEVAGAEACTAIVAEAGEGAAGRTATLAVARSGAARV